MNISLNKPESENYYHLALCNGLGYLSQYSVELEIDDSTYRRAKKTLELAQPLNQTICYEDVLMQILRGGDSLCFIDHLNKEKIIVTIEMVHYRVQKTEQHHLFDMIEERDDANTADAILQTVLYKEVIFG